MSEPIVRKGDTSTHGGQVITAASKWKCMGSEIARKGDQFQCPIHGVVTIAQGSSKWKCEGMEIARTGDLLSCGATLVSGQTKWTCA